jgi:DNA-directed RNA polymerase specialized sigma24 family protein
MDLTQDSLDELLAWLDPDRTIAGTRYEEIRTELIAFFRSRHRHDGEELADDTIGRVAARAAKIRPTYVGDPKRYFFGTANHVLIEAQRRNKLVGEFPDENLLVAPSATEFEPEYDCLEICLRRLPEEDRKLILQFYEGSKGTKIQNHKLMAKQFNTPIGNLRLRAFRIRRDLKKCISACLKNRPK